MLTRLLRNLIIGLVALILLLIIVAMFLPQKPHVEREAVINAAPSVIYPHISSARSFNEWSPWANLDPDMQLNFTGPDSGTGSGMNWSSENPGVGSGSWTISNAIPDKSINIDLDFGEQGNATSSITLTPENGQTRVTWGFDMDAGYNPLSRWFGLMLDKWVGADYEKGLNKLKALVEKS